MLPTILISIVGSIVNINIEINKKLKINIVE